MTKPSDTNVVYVECQRCGKRIPEQSAIEEEGMQLCGDCLVADVKRDVSRVQADAEEQRAEKRNEERRQIQKQQRRRSLFILTLGIIGLGIALGLSYMNRAEPTPTRSINSIKHPEIVRSMLVIGIYKYQSEHGSLPEKLGDLVPEYLNAELAGVFEQFDYAVTEENSYILEEKNNTDGADKQQQKETAQGEE
jgi:hypothetical protein